MAAPLVRYLRRLTGQPAVDGRDPAIGRHRQQLLIDSGRVIMLLGAIVLTHQLGTDAAASGNAEHVLLAFVLWLLGAALAMLSLVARQFPRLAAAGANLARALRRHLLGGL
ncbi:uncharacterized protein LOC133926969 [Phragmites australis]|uniref:uncharacterized protein LOC133926969 n=1 Tax=Phragmites australis TaxID=29695 RepID=UPI002D77B6A9|nr:uncharacterized protein LOC133926969 [Phragmites australis]